MVVVAGVGIRRKFIAGIANAWDWSAGGEVVALETVVAGTTTSACLVIHCSCTTIVLHPRQCTTQPF